MESANFKTAIYDWHENNNGRMVDFAGWQMPIQYGSILNEHHATRNEATLFDVSHMGRFLFTGSDVEKFLDRLSTRKILGMKPGSIRYSLVCNEQGGILDDVLIYRFPLTPAGGEFSMVVNAGNREKLTGWINAQIAQSGMDVTLTDTTLDTAMIAVQGPLAVGYVSEMLGSDVSTIKYFTGQMTNWDGAKLSVSRTGYTGEDGLEFVIGNDRAQDLWNRLMQFEKVSAAGLGARDTLRLEAAMPLYGHELSEDLNPAQTDLGFAISMKDREFNGRQSIADAKQNSQLPVRIGLELEGRRAAREESSILKDGRTVGTVTSGSFSPTLQKPISMGYIEPEFSAAGTSVEIDIRGKTISATVVSLPFYRRD